MEVLRVFELGSAPPEFDKVCASADRAKAKATTAAATTPYISLREIFVLFICPPEVFKAGAFDAKIGRNVYLKTADRVIRLASSFSAHWRGGPPFRVFLRWEIIKRWPY